MASETTMMLLVGDVGEHTASVGDRGLFDVFVSRFESSSVRMAEV